MKRTANLAATTRGFGRGRNVLVAALLCSLLVGCGTREPQPSLAALETVAPSPPPASQLALATSLAGPSTSASRASLSSSGISEADAIELARGHSSLMTLVSASAGSFRDLNVESGIPGIGPGFGIKPDQFVWAVTFAGEETICNPLGACFSPRPGTTAVYLDYFTGVFLSSEGGTTAILEGLAAPWTRTGPSIDR
jgi:hypothetical protein